MQLDGVLAQEPVLSDAHFEQEKLSQPVTLSSTQTEIINCDKEFFLSLEGIKKEAEIYQFYTSLFKNSGTLESQMAYALALKKENSSQSSIDVLLRLFSQHKHSKLLGYSLLSACALSQNECQQSDIDMAIQTDPQNAAIWLIAAIDALEKNDTQIATHYLEQAILSPTHNDYWGEYLVLFDTALSQAGMQDNLERKVSAIGFYSALSLPSFSKLTKFCKNTTLSEPRLIQICLQTGKK